MQVVRLAAVTLVLGAASAFWVALLMLPGEHGAWWHFVGASAMNSIVLVMKVTRTQRAFLLAAWMLALAVNGSVWGRNFKEHPPRIVQLDGRGRAMARP